MSDALQLVISAELAEKIGAHGTETYPHECCGALLGRDAGASGLAAPREILALFPLVNRRDDSPRNRFSVTSEDVVEAEKNARGQGLDVIGWYHSHPDHPARPSEFDREHAWPFYSYVIVAIAQHKPVDMTSWVLDDQTQTFSRQDIED